MSSNNPYFIRHQMNDTPGNNGGSFSSCPDIIFSTTGAPDWTPLSVPASTFLTQASYNTDYGSTVQVTPPGHPPVNNFVFLRALNTNPQGPVIPTRLWMMYTESDLALWPQNWLSSNILIGNTAQNWQDGVMLQSGGPGPYVVTGEPFLWAPPSPNPNTHYCVISMVEPFPNADPATSLSDPPFAPPTSIGYLSTFEQLVQFVLSNDWFGWRNTIDVSSLGATWQKTVPVTAPPDGGQVLVGVACNNMPTDGCFAASMQGPDPANSLNLPKTPITTPNTNLTVPVTLPPNFKTTMVITYWQGNTVPPYMANITPVLQLPTTTVAALMKGRRINRAPVYAQVLDNLTNKALGWQRVHVFGSVPLAWQTPPPTLRGLVGVPQQLATVLPEVREVGTTWQRSFPIQGPATDNLVDIGIQCSNMPTDGMFAFDVSGPTPSSSAEVPRSPITAPDMTVSVALNWPASSTGTLTISYWQGVTPPPVGASIEPLFLIEVGRNLAAAAPPALVQQVPVVGPVQGGLVYVGLACRDVPRPSSASFSLSAGQNDPNGPPLVSIGQREILDPNQILVSPVQLPPGYVGELTVNYWGPMPLPAGASIEGTLTIPADMAVAPPCPPHA